MSDIRIENIRELRLYIRAIGDAYEDGDGGQEWSPTPKQWGKINQMIISLTDVPTKDEAEGEEKIDAILEVLAALNDTIDGLREEVAEMKNMGPQGMANHHPQQYAPPTFGPTADNVPLPRANEGRTDHLSKRDSDGNPFNKDTIFDPEKSTFA